MVTRMRIIQPDCITPSPNREDILDMIRQWMHNEDIAFINGKNCFDVVNKDELCIGPVYITIGDVLEGGIHNNSIEDIDFESIETDLWDKVWNELEDFRTW